MYFIIIFLEVVVNLFSKYNIQKITIIRPSKKVVYISKKVFFAPFYKLPNKSKIKINAILKNEREFQIKKISRYFNGNIFIQKKDNKLLIFQRLKLNDYVLGVINSEINDINKLPKEVVKAFYLVVKNYSLTHLKRHRNINADFCDITHCQLYHGNVSSNNIRFLLKKLFNKRIYYKNKLAITPYSSSCGEYTCDSDIIWNKAYPYLKGRKLNSILDKWQYKLSKKNLIRIVGKNLITKLIIKNGCVKNGENFRRKINKNLGWNKIKSNVFKIKEYKNYYLIKGSGFGHNVGFCIKEAIDLAKQGMNYKEIIEYFFKNITIK